MSFTYGEPCAAPSNLTLNTQGSFYNKLNWAAAPAAQGYMVRFSGTNGNVRDPWDSSYVYTNFFDHFRANSQANYTYEVQSVCSSNRSSAWVPAIAAKTPPPNCPTPTDLLVMLGQPGEVILQWAAVPQATSYTLSYRFGLLKSSTDTTIAIGQNIAPNAKVQVRLSNQDTFKEFYGSVKTNCANSVSNKANLRSGIVSPTDAQLLAGGANLSISTANTTGTTPSLEQVLNPFDIPVSSENITDEQIADEIDRIKNPNDEIETPCGTIKIDDTSCDPLEVEIAPGTETFSPAAGKYMYINGYEILITAPNEGLLYLPLVKSRVPVGWQGLSIKESLDGTYGCVESGQVEMQGSQSGAIAADLHRQVMALLTQGPGSYSGKFIDGLDELQQLAADLAEGKPIDAKKATGVIAAVQQGIESYKTAISGYYGGDGQPLPPEIQAILGDLETLKASLNAPLATLTACANAPANASGSGKNNVISLLNFDAICPVPEDQRLALDGAKEIVTESVKKQKRFGVLKYLKTHPEIDELIEKAIVVYEYFDSECEGWQPYRQNGIVPYCLWKNNNVSPSNYYSPADGPFVAGIVDDLHGQFEGIRTMGTTLAALEKSLTNSIKLAVWSYAMCDEEGLNILEEDFLYYSNELTALSERTGLWSRILTNVRQNQQSTVVDDIIDCNTGEQIREDIESAYSYIVPLRKHQLFKFREELCAKSSRYMNENLLIFC